VTRSAATCSSSGAVDRTIFHPAYGLGAAVVAYPWHPLHGRRLPIGQRCTLDGDDLLLVEEQTGFLRRMPAWMCDEVVCKTMTLGPPMVCVSALESLAAVLIGLAANRPSPSASCPSTSGEDVHEVDPTLSPPPARSRSRARATTSSVHATGPAAPADDGRLLLQALGLPVRETGVASTTMEAVDEPETHL